MMQDDVLVGNGWGTWVASEADANWLHWSMRSPIYIGRRPTRLKSITEDKEEEDEEDEEDDVDREEARDREEKDIFGNVK